MREQGSSYFGICRWIHCLIRSHEELWIEHVLDKATKLHQTVGLQVVQRDIVQRRNLHQNEGGCHLHVSVLKPAVTLMCTGITLPRCERPSLSGDL